jgi:hypothetical protein
MSHLQKSLQHRLAARSDQVLPFLFALLNGRFKQKPSFAV